MSRIMRLAAFLAFVVLLVPQFSYAQDADGSSAPVIVQAPAAPAPHGQAPPLSATTPRLSDYVLGVGDKVRIITFGEDDLSGEFEVSSTGAIAMPLIGEIHAAGITVSQLQGRIVAALSGGYMKNPHVGVEVLNYRPFFIVGEVMKPGSYNYVNGMTVINAVALAGGYTYRADKDDIKVKHGGPDAKEEPASEGSTVLPGDVVNVPERFF